MKFRKTRFNERDTYTYVYKDEKGRVIDKVVLRPGKGGVTEVDIKMLHSLDDSEVYYNIKNGRPQLTDEEKIAVKNWEDKHPGETVPKNWNLSIESLVDEEIDQDKSSILAKASYSPLKDVPLDIDRLREVVQLLTPEQQEIYRRVLIEGESAQDVAEEMGIPSKQAMNNRLNKIKAQIKKLF